MTKEKQTA